MGNPIDDEEIGDAEGHQIHETVVSKLKGSYLNNGGADMVGKMLPEFNQLIDSHIISRRTVHEPGTVTDERFA